MEPRKVDEKKLSVQSEASRLAQTGEYALWRDVERALIRNDELDNREVRKFFDIPSNKRLIGGLVRDARRTHPQP